jgi:hypothetical protein
MQNSVLDIFYYITSLIVDSSLENGEYDRRDPLWWPRDALYPQKLALT